MKKLKEKEFCRRLEPCMFVAAPNVLSSSTFGCGGGGGGDFLFFP
jgi:hypothetical protein